MSAVDRMNQQDSQPCVAVYKVAKEYKVVSSETPSRKQHVGLQVLRRLAVKPNFVTVQALNEMSLVVSHGESVGVIGRNGSGKSTLMKLICGQELPTNGAVHASSQPIMLGVNAALVPDLSGSQNVILGCLAMGLSRQQIDDRFDDIVEISGLERSIHLPMKTYSSGMASRLRFAIAASADPEILLVDEALNTGDAQFASRSKQRMDELRAKAGCVFLVSHSLDAIKSMCSRVVWIDKGDLIMDGQPKHVIREYINFTQLLSKGRHDAARASLSEARESLVVADIRNTAPAKWRRSWS